MIKILAILIPIFLVTSCKNGDGAGPTSPPANPGPVIPGPVDPDNPPTVGLLTDREIVAIRTELQFLMKAKNFEAYEEIEKKQLAGALLAAASRNIKALDWGALTDKEVEYLFSLYFNKNLTLK